jgi:hypothetical protein
MTEGFYREYPPGMYTCREWIHGEAPDRALSHTTENKKVAGRKLLMFRMRTVASEAVSQNRAR